MLPCQRALFDRERTHELARQVFDAGQGPERMGPEQRRAGWIGPEEQGCVPEQHAGDDREAHRHVVAAEPPSPRARGRRDAEERVVHGARLRRRVHLGGDFSDHDRGRQEFGFLDALDRRKSLAVKKINF